MSTHKMIQELNKKQVDNHSLNVMHVMNPELCAIGDLIELGSETRWEAFKRWITGKPKQYHEIMDIEHKRLKLKPYVPATKE